MKTLSRCRSWLRSVAHRSRLEREIDDELRFHLELRTTDLIRSGMAPSQATRRARLEFGAIEGRKEEMREARGLRLLDDVRADLRYAWRQVRQSPGFTAVAILLIALGIGANTALFSLVNTVILRRLPVREPERLVQLLTNYPGEPRILGFSWKYYEDYRDRNQVFSDLIGVSATRFQVSGRAFQTETVSGAYVPGNFFSALGVKAALGRLIDRDDESGTAGAAVAVLSWSYWKTRFDLDPAILGCQIVLDGVPATVIGVAPREFLGLQVGLRSDVWVPAGMEPMIRRPSQRADGSLGITLMGRLKTGVSIQQARADLRILDRRRIEDVLARSKDPLWSQVTIDVEPAATGFSGLRDQFGRPLLALMAMVALLLLISCTNVASMLLARGTARRREMAVRVALGAGRLRLVRQVLTESMVLSATGALLGIVVAYFGADALVRTIASGRPVVGWAGPIAVPVQLDTRVLLFTAATALLTGLLFGLAPAWSAWASAPASSLRDFGTTGEPWPRRSLGKSLVVTQVALSVVLLTGAGLFVRHLSHLRNVDLGFRRDSVLLVVLNPQGSGYNRLQLTRLYRDLLERLKTIPGVRSVSLSGTTPIEGGAASRLGRIEGFDERPEDRRYLMLNWVSPKYFETFGTPLVAGRDFEFEDEGRPRVAIVNQAMARHYFRGGRPIGKHVRFDGDERPYEIVGVVADAKYVDVHDIAPRTVYLNAFQEGGIGSQFALRTNVAPMAVADEVRRAVGDVVKTIRVTKVTTLAEQVDAAIVPERLIALLAGFFGALGALMAAVGLYGLLAFMVARRTNEIGIRMALGATRASVRAMVLKSALGLVGAGLVVGVPMAIWSTRLVASVIANLPGGTSVPIVVAALTMAGVAVLASYEPARRAARVHPIDALRHS